MVKIHRDSFVEYSFCIFLEVFRHSLGYLTRYTEYIGKYMFFYSSGDNFKQSYNGEYLPKFSYREREGNFVGVFIGVYSDNDEGISD